jgi:hypothetical protein
MYLVLWNVSDTSVILLVLMAITAAADIISCISNCSVDLNVIMQIMDTATRRQMLSLEEVRAPRH